MLLSNGTALYAHVAYGLWSLRPSCGTTVCFTARKNGETEWHHCSRIDGVIGIGDLQYAITTAHSMLKRYYDTCLSTPPRPDDGDGPDASSESEDEDEDDATTNPDDEAGRDAKDMTSNRAHPKATSLELRDWRPVQHKGPINFLGVGSDEYGLAAPGVQRKIRSDSGTAAPPSDFALLDGPILLEGPFEPTEISTVSEADEGKIYVAAGSHYAQHGYLLPQASAVLTRQAWMTTRKIELRNSLGKINVDTPR
jgi:hypothetical protein